MEKKTVTSGRFLVLGYFDRVSERCRLLARLPDHTAPRFGRLGAHFAPLRSLSPRTEVRNSRTEAC